MINDTQERETKTVADWLKEAIHIRRNAASMGWTGGVRFVSILNGFLNNGWTREGFYGWLDRIERAKKGQ